MAKPALRIYEMTLRLTNKPDKTFHVTLYSPHEDAGMDGVVILLPDVGENANRYRLMAKEHFVPSGYSLVVPDLIGFGQSSGERGMTNMAEVRDLVDVTVRMIAKQCSSVPVFLYGHGLGGNIVLNYLIDREHILASHDAEADEMLCIPNYELFAGAIVSAPWLERYRPHPDFIHKMAGFIGKILPKLTVKTKAKADQQTDDYKIIQDIQQDKLCYYNLPLSFLCEIRESGQRAKRQAAGIALPLLLMYGTDDDFISIEAIEAMSAELPDYMYTVPFEGFLHDVHSMVARKTVYETVQDFIERCIRRAAAPCHPPVSVLELAMDPVVEEAVAADAESADLHTHEDAVFPDTAADDAFSAHADEYADEYVADEEAYFTDAAATDFYAEEPMDNGK